MCNEVETLLESIMSGNGLPDSSSTAESDGTQVVNRGENGIWVTNFELDDSIQTRNK